MEIVGDHAGLDVEHGEEEPEVGPERFVGELGVEIAEMRGEERLAAERHAEGALQLRPDRDQRPRRRHREPHDTRREPTRTPDREAHADDGVLAAAVDRAVVGEEGVGDVAEPLARFVVGDRDGLVGAVAARQHERPARVGHEEMVERRVGEHHAELRRPRRHRPRDHGPVASRQENDRPLA